MRDGETSVQDSSPSRFLTLFTVALRAGTTRRRPFGKLRVALSHVEGRYDDTTRLTAGAFGASHTKSTKLTKFTKATGHVSTVSPVGGDAGRPGRCWWQ